MKLSDQLEGWLTGEGEKTLGSLVDTFGDKSFALLLVVLLAVPALPLPTGGVTHVFEVIAVLVAVELILGRDQVWLPARWRGRQLTGPRQQRFVASLMKLIRWLERYSHPRLTVVFGHRLTNILLGLVVVFGSAAAFLAPPFSGLDTVPSLGVVVLALAVLLEDFAIVVVGVMLVVAGIVLDIVVGVAALHGIESLL